MDHLWAPWRLSYVAAEKPTEPPGDGPEHCFVCRGLAAGDDRSHLILLRAEFCAVVLNKFPYNNGHLMVVPRAHRANLTELSDEELLEIQRTMQRMIGLLELAMKPDGFNCGLNLGRAAGAGLPGHLHWHIVPRWNGDTNFMPVLGNAKVMVQSLEASYDLLSSILAT